MTQSKETFLMVQLILAQMEKVIGCYVGVFINEVNLYHSEKSCFKLMNTIPRTELFNKDISYFFGYVM